MGYGWGEGRGQGHINLDQEIPVKKQGRRNSQEEDS